MSVVAEKMTVAVSKPTVVECLTAVMASVGSIGKNRVNDQQKFRFRGIDDVMNALHPALIEHGVIVMPEVQERIAETRQTKAGGGMNVVHLRVRFTFYGPAGDKVTAETWGEAQDSADKSTNKAHSAAYKVAMLEALSIPTEDSLDADQRTVEAAPARPLPPAEISDPTFLAEAEGKVAAVMATMDRDAGREVWDELSAAVFDRRLSEADSDRLKGELRGLRVAS